MPFGQVSLCEGNSQVIDKAHQLGILCICSRNGTQNEITLSRPSCLDISMQLCTSSLLDTTQQKHLPCMRKPPSYTPSTRAQGKDPRKIHNTWRLCPSVHSISTMPKITSAPSRFTRMKQHHSIMYSLPSIHLLHICRCMLETLMHMFILLSARNINKH